MDGSDLDAPGVDDLVGALRDCVSRRDEILEAYLFGSAARGASKGHSDLDLAVFVRANDGDPVRYPYGYRADLTAALAAALGRDDIDVVILNDAGPLLYQRVLRDGIRIWSRDLAATTTREGRAISRYCDYLPQLRKLDALHARRIQRGAFGR